MGSFFSKKSQSPALGRFSRAEDVAAGIDASNLTAIVTGGNAGIGAETVRVLAKQGARVVIAARSTDKAEKLRASILESLPGVPAAKILCMRLDLASLASVRSFANKFLAGNLPLHLLINNAGVMFMPYTLTPDRIETQYATNHLGHFLLTNLLLNRMRETAEETGIQGRIVILSSVAHTNLRYPRKPVLEAGEVSDAKLYNPRFAYGHSKLCNVLHAKALAARVREAGVDVTVNAVHPGIIRTALWSHSWLMKCLVGLLYIGRWKSVEQGAATTVAAALLEEMKGVSGEYLEDCRVSKASNAGCDVGLAKKMWEVSEKLVAEAAAVGGKKTSGGGEGEGEGL